MPAMVVPLAFSPAEPNEAEFANVLGFVGHSTMPGKPGAPHRYARICTQCGAPHQPKTSICLYCLTPKADAGPIEMVEITTLEDAEPRYLPRYAVEPFAPPRK